MIALKNEHIKGNEKCVCVQYLATQNLVHLDVGFRIIYVCVNFSKLEPKLKMTPEINLFMLTNGNIRKIELFRDTFF